MSTKVLYSDLDGTMVGPGGCFVRADSGELTTEPSAALVELLGSGVELVLVSGRSVSQLQEAGRIFGADGYIAEVGAIISWDRGRRSSRLPSAAPEDFAGPLVAQLESVGLIDALLSRYEGRLMNHAPWHLDHETDVMMLGQVDVDEVDKWLVAQGYPWLTCVDNGQFGGQSRTELTGPPHIYHLMARGISKGRGVASDLERRGLAAENAVAVGDSLSDLEMAGYVEQLFLVANGADVPSIRKVADSLSNVTICNGSVGEGWAQAARWAAANAESPNR